MSHPPARADVQSQDFASPTNADYLDELYQRYLVDPQSVPPEWRGFFRGMEFAGQRPAGTASASGSAAAQGPGGGARPEVAAASLPATPREAIRPLGIYDMVHTYREFGHYCASLDPLNTQRPEHPMLDLANFGIIDGDLTRDVGQGGFQGTTDGTLQDLIDKLRQTYCRHVGVEFTNIPDKEQREWLAAHMEPVLNRPALTTEQRKSILFQLIAAEDFEQYLGRAFIGAKRFSLEGGESLVLLLNTIVDDGASLGTEQIIMTMAHRGRLNILAHVMNKPYETLLGEFEGTNAQPRDVEGDGDVKYHLGYANKRTFPDGRCVKVSMLPNPSHLELVNPIQQGIVRCKQEWLPDPDRTKVVPVTMHGDAAFCGQGIVTETLNLSELPGYRTGGTIHIIVNNQIGFTTSPTQGRFTPYPTDVAKSIDAPVFHVNGDDPEAVVHVAKLAIAFRQRFKCDVIIDLWCYRRHGHNEQDEPSFTQPVMYRKIGQQKTTRTLYAERLASEGVVPQAEQDAMRDEVLARLKDARERAKKVMPRERIPTFSGVWRGFGRAGSDWSADTIVPRQRLDEVIGTLDKVPADFTVHPKLVRMIEQRKESVRKGEGIDWGTGEMLALGSLLAEGINVRFTGQDVERGTFSHRHTVLHDYENGRVFTPLKHINEADQGSFTIMNTMLSEEAVVAYEWGFASADPRNLVVWEAQFGDFVNGAQAIIDQIIAASESKWRYMCGLVLNLPHGYEGQGPEHSNAYLERFLHLCAEGNMQVAVPSTPAQYFHLLRRQMHRKFRKPLILMMPKKLLRYAPAASRVEEFTDRQLQLVLDDPSVNKPEGVKRLCLCAGKVYYTLKAAIEKDNVQDVAVVRVEQLYPFPKCELQDVLDRYARVADVCWVQEEPRNRGAWSYMEPRLRELMPDRLISYVGRDAAASPATGSPKAHELEEQGLVKDALDFDRRNVPASAA